jgi:hypothetical protein
MSEAEPLIKMGAFADGVEMPVRYANVWSVEQASGPERSIIGPSERHIDVLLSLAEGWREPVNSGQLIYDRHNRNCAYGDLDKYIATLQKQGFQKGRVILPTPHSHHYHPENDSEEEQLTSHWEWRYFPLQPGD